MDLINIIGLIVGGLGFLATVCGGIAAYGRLQQKVKDCDADKDDLRNDIKALEGRVDAAEEKATSVAGLAASLESALGHMGDKFAAEMRHLAEVSALNNKFLGEQLAEIKTRIAPKDGQ